MEDWLKQSAPMINATLSRPLLLLCLFALTCLAGCARMKVTRLTAESDYEDGIRFYRPVPYLVLTKDAKGALAANVISLPDKNQEYVIQQEVGIGTSNLTVTLDQGWNLVALGHELDSKVPEMITALTGAAGALPFKAGGGSSRSSVQVALYRFVVKDGIVIGLERLSEDTLVGPAPTEEGQGGPTE